MNTTPSANRKHIAIYGKRNAGKSSLMNAIIGQEVSIVSEIKGTTTDAISKPMELLPLGPVVFIDTAGLDDEGILGDLRVKSALKILERTDFALYILDAFELTEAAELSDESEDEFKTMIKRFKQYHIPYLMVFNKVDLLSDEQKKSIAIKYPEATLVSSGVLEDIHALKDKLIQAMSGEPEEPTLLGDLVPHNGTVVMVVPVDSEAPKGRLILPQVQLIRDCLDHGIKSYVVRDTELEAALKDLSKVDLVVTDSQAFAEVSKIVPRDMPLTSFSILFARHKGDLASFVSGAEAVSNLKEGSRVLISESCTHNHSHEDIGRVKIPKLLNKFTGKTIEYEFKMGHDLPVDLSPYDLVIHCGSCMLNQKTMMTRIDYCEQSGTPITNYGVVLALMTGIMDRSLEIFRDKNVLV
jgi:[FeFe] hydrogenase H-cluster maturation GTPase HydF